MESTKTAKNAQINTREINGPESLTGAYSHATVLFPVNQGFQDPITICTM